MAVVEYYADMFMRFPPHPHQRDEFENYRDHKSRALLWAPRNGKTKATIDQAFYLSEQRKIKTVIILAPSGVQYNWVVREIPTHRWEGVPHRAHYWKSSDKAVHTAMCADLATKDLLFLAFNHESLLLERVLKLITNALKRGPALLVVDESHCYRTPGSRRTKRIRGLAKHFAYRRILTGTPVSNSPLAAFAQYEILEAGALGFKTYGEFKRRYSNDTGFSHKTNKNIPIEFQNLDELNVKVGRWSSVVDRGMMSGFVNVIKDFEMTKEQAAMYKALKEELVLTTESGDKVTAVATGAKLIKLQQVLSGFIKHEDGRIIQLVPNDKNPRLLALKETLSELDGKVIIWAKFKHELKTLAETLGDKAVEFHGDVKPGDRQVAIDRFMKDPECLYFIGQPQAGGTGINLSAAKHIVWYSHVFDSIDRIQATERATAIGGHEVSVTDICCPGTLDSYILKKLADKQSLAAQTITAKDI